MNPKDESLRDSLEEEILTGILLPGEKLDESSLAKRFGVSRTPIREALFQLAAAGLLIHQPRRGNFVAEIGPKRLVEMFDVMAELEAMCARLAARRATDSDIAAIRTAHSACAEMEQSDDADTYYYRNEVFHKTIRSASHNSFLAKQTEQLHRRLRAYRRLQLRTRGRINTSHKEHTSIIDAIENGQAEAAATIMREHVVVQGERFADLLASIDEQKSNKG
ncbi:MAG: GntR family transcriptional regulator [Arenicella sp.]